MAVEDTAVEMNPEGHGSIVVHITTFLVWTGGVAAFTWFICRYYMGRSKSASDDYFAGGRALKWYIVAGSLMLTNLSTEQLVGLNGTIFSDGCLAGIWWEAGAAIAMLVTATVFLPRYMALGLTTTSGFLGERYDVTMRTLVSVIFLLYYAVVLCPLVLYTGALAIKNMFELDVPLWVVSLVIGLLGSAYALGGGLKAVAVSDCLNGIGLVIIGLWVPIAALQTLPNGFSTLFEDTSYLKPLVANSEVLNKDSHMRSMAPPSVPWDVTLTGLALTNMYYWSTNQVIVQRVLAAESLAQGQKGVLFAASMKVVGFSFLCLPGIIGLIMSNHGVVIDGKTFTVNKADEVYSELVKAVMPKWSLGFLSAVLIGSVLSTFNSALNSASTMFGLEIYKIYINKEASDKKVVQVATIFGACLAVLSFGIAPQLVHVGLIFGFLQRMNTVVSLPIVTVFFVGMAASMPDAFAAKVGFGVAVVTGTVGQLISELHFLHLYFIGFLLAAGAMALTTYVPAVRKLLRQLPTPPPYVDAKDENKVSIAPWASLRPMVAAVTALLAFLIVTLQVGSSGMFYTFWAVWLCAIVTLMWLPSGSSGRKGSDAKAVNNPDLEEADNQECSKVDRPVDGANEQQAAVAAI